MSYVIRLSFCLLVLTTNQIFAEQASQVPADAKAELLKGLKRINVGDIDEWFTKSCHPELLCINSNAKKSLKKYNMPALKRMVGKCFHGTAKDTLKVTRVQNKGDMLKLYIECDAKAKPRSFTLKKHNGQWMFTKL